MKYATFFMFVFFFAWVAVKLPDGMSKFPTVQVNLKQANGSVQTLQIRTQPPAMFSSE